MAPPKLKIRCILVFKQIIVDIIITIITNMEKAPQQYKQVMETEPVAVHRLKNGWKWFKDIGHLIVYEHKSGSYWYNINHGLTYELIKDTVFYKIVYESFTTYIWEVLKGGFVSFSFENGSGALPHWEETARKIGSIEDFAKALESPPVHKKIEYHCADVEKTSVHKTNMLTPIFQWGGKAQDTVVGGAKSLWENTGSNNNEEGYVEKTKKMASRSWGFMKDKWNSMKESVTGRHQNGEVAN